MENAGYVFAGLPQVFGKNIGPILYLWNYRRREKGKLVRELILWDFLW
jgi:hypothetical protein